VDFSIRVAVNSTANERGQAVVEYMLILICIVAIIFGITFQFNNAFKVWANNYFGDYLTCILETGDLPSIGGTPGDSAICNQFFKPFSLADGRPFKNTIPNQPGATPPPSATPPSHGERESKPKQARRSSGGGQNGGGGGNSGGGSKANALVQTKPDTAGGSGSHNTGNMTASGGGYGTSGGRRSSASGKELDGRGGGINNKENANNRGYASGTARDDGSNGRPRRLKLKPIVKAPEVILADDTFTIGNFLRFLIIAGILIALLLLLGGQSLQIGKSME
jgi:hypothetical protein